jgi:streptomycin 3"-adenylyltransferase
VQVERLLQGVRDLLEPDLRGAYLHGSAVLGGGGPRSDIDVIAVAARRTTADEKRRLAELLLNLSRQPSPIEFDLVVESEIRPWRHPAPFDFHYDELVRERFESGALEPWPEPTNRDLAAVVTMVLAGNVSLFGPPPAEVFEPVPRGDYLDALLRNVEMADEWLDWDTRNVVLTLPRVWAGVATDEVHSKQSAAAWTLARLPEEHRAVLERAVAIYRGDRDEFWDDIRPQVRAYADYVLSEISSAIRTAST